MKRILINLKRVQGNLEAYELEIMSLNQNEQVTQTKLLKAL